MEGIDFFVKIGPNQERKEDKFKSLEEREASSSHLKTDEPNMTSVNQNWNSS